MYEPRPPFSVRLSPQERAEIAARAKQDGERKGSARWARDALLAAARRAPLLSGEELGALIEVAERMRQLGVNLNQLTRRVNQSGTADAGDRLYDRQSVQDLFDRITETQDEVRAILERQNFMEWSPPAGGDCPDLSSPAVSQAERLSRMT